VEPVGWTGPDLTGTGAGLRGQAAGQPSGPQSNGPRVAALQAFLNRAYPAYSDLATDGWYGEATAGVLRQFAARSGIDGADGLNIGPKLAAALAKAGFERTVSAARARVLGHVGRRTRR
jgi:peptidoglycan hydrolase-like protein with peptidoglycan-binding domain